MSPECYNQTFQSGLQKESAPVAVPRQVQAPESLCLPLDTRDDNPLLPKGIPLSADLLIELTKLNLNYQLLSSATSQQSALRPTSARNDRRLDITRSSKEKLPSSSVFPVQGHESQVLESGPTDSALSIRELHNQPPKKPDCQLFLRGRCHYGAQCKYNHPPRAARASSARSSSRGGSSEKGKNREVVYPVRPGAPDCQYYLKTGKCNYGARCRFNHPHRDENLVNALNRRDCFDFVQTGTCPYGASCKYNHPAASPGSSVTYSSSSSVNGSSTADKPEATRRLLSLLSEDDLVSAVAARLQAECLEERPKVSTPVISRPSRSAKGQSRWPSALSLHLESAAASDSQSLPLVSSNIGTARPKPPLAADMRGSPPRARIASDLSSLWPETNAHRTSEGASLWPTSITLDSARRRGPDDFSRISVTPDSPYRLNEAKNQTFEYNGSPSADKNACAYVSSAGDGRGDQLSYLNTYSFTSSPRHEQAFDPMGYESIFKLDGDRRY